MTNIWYSPQPQTLRREYTQNVSHAMARQRYIPDELAAR